MSSSAPDLRSRSVLARGAVALFAAAILLLAGRASASVVPLTLEELVGIAEEVHTVEVLGTESYVYNGKIVTRAKFQVLETFKGTMSGQSEIDYLGGDFHIVSSQATGSPRLQEGQTEVLFLSYPIRQLSPGERARFNTSSPLISSPQLVGGQQGSFTVTKTQVDGFAPAVGENQTRATNLTRRQVVRSGGVAPRRESGEQIVITYGLFANEIHRLVAEQTAMVARRVPPRQLPGIRGEFHIPQRDPSRFVRRAFDPLPKIAYYSDEELLEINKKADAIRGNLGNPVEPESTQAPETIPDPADVSAPIETIKEDRQ